MSTLLSGILGASFATASALGDTDVEASLGENNLTMLNNLGNALDEAGTRLAGLFDVSASIDAVAPTGKMESSEGRNLSRVMLAQALTGFAMSDKDAVTATAGLESDEANVGNEAFSTVKEYAIKVIEWIQKKWKEFSAVVSKYFNKFFGDVEGLKKSWLSILETAKERQSGYTLEKNAKHEFEKGSDTFYKEEAMIEAKDLAKGVESYREIALAIVEKTMDYSVEDLSPEDLMNSEGTALISVSAFIAKVNGSNVTKGLESVLKKSTPSTAPAKFINGDDVCSDALLGRVRFYLSSASNSETDATAALKSYKFGFGNLTEQQKTKTKANMSLAEASVVEGIADANIELLDALINMKRNKSIDKAETKLDKASKALDKWKKSAPGSDEAQEKRSAYRESTKLATEYFSFCRRLLIAMPLEFCGQAKTISSLQKDFANKSLSAHTKD